LAPNEEWLLSGYVIVYDTESDGVGATSSLALIREYHFLDVATGETLNVLARRKGRLPEPLYSHDSARQQILSFIESAEFLVAYEPPSNDRNRLSLFGDEVYPAQVEPKVIDLKRTVINHLFTTNKSKVDSFIYLRCSTQPDVDANLLQVGTVSYPEPNAFLPIPETWKTNIGMKCCVDVLILQNFLCFQSVLSQ
jgi:hypothetical protein